MAKLRRVWIVVTLGVVVVGAGGSAVAMQPTPPRASVEGRRMDCPQSVPRSASFVPSAVGPPRQGGRIETIQPTPGPPEADVQWLTLTGAQSASLAGIDPAITVALTLELRLQGTAKAAIEVILAESDDKASFRRRIELEPGDWQTVEVPLRWMRWGEGRVPRWPNIRSLTLDAGDHALELRRSGLRHSGNGAGALPDPDEMIRLAFGDAKVARGEFPGLRVWSAADEVDTERLATHLAAVRRLILDEWGLPEQPQDGRPPTLLVFADRAAYREFVPRYASALGAAALRPDSGGFHLQGWALSYHDPRQGSLRPVFTHEFSHSVLAHHGLIDGARSDWFHEGIAVRLQTRFHPQDDLGDIIRRGLRRSALPLRELCDGRHLERRHYWQAMTVVDWLVDSGRVNLETRRKLLAAMQAAGGTALGPHLGSVLETDWDRLETDWRTWTRTRWSD